MTHKEFNINNWMQLLGVLDNILEGKNNLTEYCRQVRSFYYDLELDNRKLILPFEAFVSDTDAFPLGEVRILWAPDALKEMDLKRANIENLYKKSIEDAANELRQFVKRKVIIFEQKNFSAN